jgi:hypothetical protein
MLLANIWSLGVRRGGEVKAPKLGRQELLNRVSLALTTGEYRILPHARQRCSERDVSLPDIEVVLEQGHHVPRRDRYDERLFNWSYCFEGQSVDGMPLRVIVAFEGWMLVVTVVRLGGGLEG